MNRKKYQKRSHLAIPAVQMNIDTDGLTYQKWGGTQIGKKGDWLVDNDGDVYTVDQESFAKTYVEVSKGLYLKQAPVWAEIAETSGAIKTKEGHTQYDPGDYLVFNNEDSTDGYATKPEKFNAMYELA